MNGILKPLKNGSAGVDFETSGILYLLPNITNTAAATPGQVAPQSDIYKLRAGQTLADKVIGFGYGFANNKPITSQVCPEIRSTGWVACG